MELTRRDFLKYAAAYGAVMALPSCLRKEIEVAETGIEVKSSYMKDYEKKGSIAELRKHFIRKIKPKMPELFKEIYDNTMEFGLDLEKDQQLLAKVFDKIKKDKNYENVIINEYPDEKDITIFNPFYREYFLDGRFNNLEMSLLFDVNPEFTEINGMNFYIYDLNLDERLKNQPNGIYKGDFRGDLFEEFGGWQSPYLKIFTRHSEGDEVDIGGLRILLIPALNKQELIQKDLSLIRGHITGEKPLKVRKSKSWLTEDIQGFFSVGKKK